jgi:hypothetical protein
VEDNHAFMCPITMCRMQDPVIAMDGHSYERTAIVQWLQKNKRSPMTNEPIKNKMVVPNYNLRKLIAEAVDRRAQ